MTICGDDVGIARFQSELAVQSRGAHIILSRDDARRLFGAGDDEALRNVVAELLAEPGRREAGRLLDGVHWKSIHRALTDGTLEPDAGEFPLNQCILGGRRLHSGREFEAVLIRPDVAPRVADSLRALSEAEFQQRFQRLAPEALEVMPTGDPCSIVWQQLQDLQQFFQSAAAEREAILFTAARPL